MSRARRGFAARSKNQHSTSGAGTYGAASAVRVVVKDGVANDGFEVLITAKERPRAPARQDLASRAQRAMTRWMRTLPKQERLELKQSAPHTWPQHRKT
jgi:hypothetical protein